MAILSIPLFDFQKHLGFFDWVEKDKDVIWSEDEQLKFIDQVVRNGDSNEVLCKHTYSPLILRESPRLTKQTYKSQCYDVVGAIQCIETLQKFFLGELPVPQSLEDCIIFKPYHYLIFKGKEPFAQFGLLPSPLREKIFKIRYPVEIIL